MSATDDDNRGEPPFIFPDERPNRSDCDSDGDLYHLEMNDDGSPKSWNHSSAGSLEHNTIWSPGDLATRQANAKKKGGTPNGAPPLPPAIKILALRGE